MRNDILQQKTKILKWVSENQSKAFICRKLRCKPETLGSYLQKMEISYKGNQGGKGTKHDPKRLTAKEYATKVCVKSHILRIKLIQDGIKKPKCENCKLGLWMGKFMPLELHHKDRNHYNNDLKNLMILCCNCHKLIHEENKMAL